MSDITHILQAIVGGDPQAASALLPLVYEELRHLAARRLAGEAPGQTLQPTALVHEVYLKRVGPNPQRTCHDRAHFFAAAAEAMRRIVIDASLTKQVRGELDWIVMKALEKDRGRRYETANGFAMDVQRYLTGEVVLAAPPSASYRLRKLARKHRAALASVAVIAVLLLAGIAGTTTGLIQAQAAEQEAIRAQAAEAERAEGERLAKHEALAAAAAEKQGRESLPHAGELAALAHNLLEQKNWAEAEAALRECLAIRQKLQPDEWTTCNTQSMLGEALLGEQKYADAEPLLLAGNEGLKKHVAAIPEPLRSARQIEALQRLVRLFEAQGKSSEAARWQKELEAVQGRANDKVPATAGQELTPHKEEKSKTSAAHPQDPKDDFVLAEKKLAEGETSDAIQLFERIYKQRTEKLGKDNPQTLAALTSLGRAWLAYGEGNNAVRCFEEVIRSYNAIFPVPPQRMTLMEDLARAYWSIGRMAETIRLFEEILATYKAQLRPDHPRTLIVARNLATAYGDTGRINDAARLFGETNKTLLAKLGPDHPDTLQAQTGLARLHLLLNDYANGEKVAKEAHEHWSKRIQSMSNLAQIEREQSDFANLQSILGECLSRQNKLAESEPLLLAGYEGIKKHAAKMSPQARDPRLAEALNRLVQLYDAAGKKDEAAKWRKELEARKSDTQTMTCLALSRTFPPYV